MKSEEYKALLAKMIADPDTAQETAGSIMEEIDKDFAYIATAKDTITKGEEKIKDLTTQVNAYKAREFLGTFGKPEEKEEEEKPKQRGIDWDAILKDAEVNTDGK